MDEDNNNNKQMVGSSLELIIALIRMSAYMGRSTPGI